MRVRDDTIVRIIIHRGCVTTLSFFFSSRRRHTRLQGDWSSDVCSSDLDLRVEQVSNPAKLPDPSLIEEIREPVIATKIFVPQDYVGPVITLCTQKRGTQDRKSVV